MELIRRSTGHGCALYSPDGELDFFSFLLRGTPTAAPRALSPAAAWDYPGCFVWAEGRLRLTADELAALLDVQGPVSEDTRALAWLSAVPTLRALLPLVADRPTAPGDAGTGHTGPHATDVPFGNVSFQVAARCPITVQTDRIVLGPAQTGTAELVRGTTGINGLQPNGAVAIAFAGRDAGALCFPADWDPHSLFQLFEDNPFDTATPPRGGDIRFFRASAGGLYEQFRYPMMPPVDPDASAPPLSLDVSLDPAAPFDGARTRLDLRVGCDVTSLVSDYARTTAGRPIGLVPRAASTRDRAGFYLGLRAPVTPDQLSEAQVYLAPRGSFTLSPPGVAGALHVMCGLNSLEAVTLAGDDVIELVPSQPAVVARAGGDGPLLTPEFTTSWVRFESGSYLAQPGASVSYGLGVIPTQPGSGEGTLPLAVVSHVRDLRGTAPVPLAWYGGRSTLGRGASDPAELQEIENSALAPSRGGQLRTDAARDDPLPLRDTAVATPVFTDAGGVPLRGGGTSTPQGFVAELNDGTVGPAGTWARLHLARSGHRQLTFGPADDGTVPAWLATVLLQDQLFLVLTDWQQFPLVQRVLAVGGFDVEVGPDPAAPDAAHTILVLKYNTSRRLTDLIHTPGSWAHSEVFVGDAEAVRAAQGRLFDALDVAERAQGRPSDPFQGFRDRISSTPEWTGVLSFNGAINGSGLSPDLQMLCAGVDGQLRAHHLGVEVNRVASDSAGMPAIQDSSLFAVVHYEPGVAPVLGKTDDPAREADDYGYSLDLLDVSIGASAVTGFHAEALVTINSLFGRETALDPPASSANTLRLTGSYQKEGSVGTVTFSGPSAAHFTFPASGHAVRVLDAFDVRTVTLAPGAAATSDEDLVWPGTRQTGSEIRSRLSLGGELLFLPEPFPGAPGMDLFSYGADGRGVGVSGIALDITSQLDGEGKRVGPPVIVPDLSTVVVADTPEALRQGGLVNLLPVSLDGFLQNPAGLSASALAALPLNVVDLAPPVRHGPPPPHDDEREKLPDRSSLVTTAPHFALRFRLPLGSLGALADAHASLEGALILGWGPSPFTPDNDAVGVFVELPALSAGMLGFDLQGLLKTTFGDANLARVESKHGPVYVLLFNNVALSFFGMTFPPKVITNLILFAGGGDAQSLGWSLAATQLTPAGSTNVRVALGEAR